MTRPVGMVSTMPGMRERAFDVVLFAVVMGCSANGGGGGGSTTTGIDCAAVCARLAGAPNCAGSAPSECNATCTGLIVRAGSACGTQLDALSACVTTAPVRCVGTGLNPFTGCDAQFLGAINCANRQPQDAGP